MPGGSDIQDWFKSLPIFTRYWFGGTIIFTLLGRFSLLNPRWLILGWDLFITRFEAFILTLIMMLIIFWLDFTFGDQLLLYFTILSHLRQDSTSWSTFIFYTIIGNFNLWLFKVSVLLWNVQFETRNRNFWWKTSRLFLHVVIQLDVGHHRGPVHGHPGADGPHGDGHDVRLVPAQQGHHRQLLVWNTVQGNVPSMGVVWLQPHNCRY